MSGDHEWPSSCELLDMIRFVYPKLTIVSRYPPVVPIIIDFFFVSCLLLEMRISKLYIEFHFMHPADDPQDKLPLVIILLDGIYLCKNHSRGKLQQNSFLFLSSIRLFPSSSSLVSFSSFSSHPASSSLFMLLTATADASHDVSYILSSSSHVSIPIPIVMYVLNHSDPCSH